MWGYIVLVLAVAGAPVFAGAGVTFSEVARGSSRIVSGWEAQRGQIPHQISLRMVNQLGTVSTCGGSVIHNEWAITAAHCTAQRPTLVIRFGTLDLTRPALMMESTEWYNHPLYNNQIPGVVQPNDVSVIKFRRRIEFNDVIKPIRIQRSADMFKDYDGQRLVASGWGRTWTNGESPTSLNWVYLLGVNNTYCLNRFSGSSIIQPTTICAGAYNVSSQSTCQGDSGGPLTIIDEDGELSLVGVASFVSGTGCHTGFPAGFVRPGAYHEWYEEVTGINFDWDFEPEGSGDPESPEEESSEESSSSSEESSSEEDKRSQVLIE